MRFYKAAKKFCSNRYAQAAAVGSAVMSQAHAALDTTAVSTGISSAVVTGETAGTLVIGAVAALVVIGLVIGIVKKL